MPSVTKPETFEDNDEDYTEDTDHIDDVELVPVTDQVEPGTSYWTESVLMQEWTGPVTGQNTGQPTTRQNTGVVITNQLSDHTAPGDFTPNQNTELSANTTRQTTTNQQTEQTSTNPSNEPNTGQIVLIMAYSNPPVRL